MLANSWNVFVFATLDLRGCLCIAPIRLEAQKVVSNLASCRQESHRRGELVRCRRPKLCKDLSVCIKMFAHGSSKGKLGSS